MLILACFSVSAQTAKPIVQIKDMGGSLRFIHNNGTYTEIPKQSVGAILTFPNSPSVQVTVLSEGSIDRILGFTYMQIFSPSTNGANQLADSISSYLNQNSGGGSTTPIATTDTLKGLVYTAIAKVRTNRDTLFNCKSLSFGRKSGASGTLVLTYENGESESYDVANDDLPTWVNGEFISYIDYNATGAVGLIVNTLGCSQTSTEICAKVKPIFDCELVVPITCNGWQSASGVWQTISGCWNTGQ